MDPECVANIWSWKIKTGMRKQTELNPEGIVIDGHCASKKKTKIKSHTLDFLESQQRLSISIPTQNGVFKVGYSSIYPFPELFSCFWLIIMD